MSTAESTRNILFEQREPMGTLEPKHGGCMVEFDGRDICLPYKGVLLNVDCGCGYC